MNKKTTLDAYFQRLHGTEAIGSEEFGVMIDQAGVMADARSRRRGVWRSFGIAAAVVTVAGAGWYLTAREETAPAGAIAPRSVVERPHAATGGAPVTDGSAAPVAAAPIAAAPGRAETRVGNRNEFEATLATEVSMSATRPAVRRRNDGDHIGMRRSGLPTPVSTQADQRRRVAAPVSMLDVGGVRPVELDDDALGAIGIARRDGGAIDVYTRGFIIDRRWPDSLIEYVGRTSFGPDRSHAWSASRAELPRRIAAVGAPVVVTDDRGVFVPFQQLPMSEGRARLENAPADSTATAQSVRALRVANLIPVRVIRRCNGKCDTNVAAPHDIILWFRPSPAFLDALPLCVSDRLHAEFAAMASSLQREETEREERYRRQMSPHQLRQYDSIRAIWSQPCTPCPASAVTGTPYLDSWRASAGAVRLSPVTPNPAVGRIGVRFDLTARRAVGVSLHDTRGRRLRTLEVLPEQSSGTHAIELDLSAVPAGVYLLVVATDHGERAVQRLLVSR